MNENERQNQRPIPGRPRSSLLRLLPRLIYAASRLIGPLYARSLRWVEVDRSGLARAEQLGRGVILCTWHGDLATQVLCERGRGLTALISPHWIGELIAQAVEALGYRTVRASRNLRRLEGMRGLLRELARGERLVMIPDGPSGPRRRLGTEIVLLASRTGAPVLPLFGAGRPSVRFPSWDRSEWPLPFARAAFRYGEPVEVPRELAEGDAERYAGIISSELARLEREVRADLRR